MRVDFSKFTYPIWAKTESNDSFADKFQKNWLLLSENIWANPFAQSYSHNYITPNPEEKRIGFVVMQLFAWVILARSAYLSFQHISKTGLLKGRVSFSEFRKNLSAHKPLLHLLWFPATFCPKLIHRSSVSITKLFDFTHNYMVSIDLSKAQQVDLSNVTSPCESSMGVGATHNGGKETWCDWAYTSSVGFGMIFDGMGHNRV